MTNRETASILVLVAAAAGLLGWTVLEGRRQRAEIEAAVSAHAAVLAASLGPGLAAAETAERELDDLLASRLLDGARLLSLQRPDAAALDRFVAAGPFDSIAYLDARGAVETLAGTAPGAALAADCVTALSDREVDELVLSTPSDDGSVTLAAAVERADGGTVLVSLDVAHGHAFANGLGVERLLEGIVGSGGVVYLELVREEAGTVAGATWDGGPLPPPAAAGTLTSLRGHRVFEVSAAVAAPAGARARLRVGIDAAPLQAAAASALRRTTLVALVLLLATVAGAAYTVVRAGRLRERERAAERLSVSEAACRRSERLAAAGALTAGLAHEVRSPLNAIALAAQRIERGAETSSGSARLAARIRGEVRRLDGTLSQFLDLARPVSARREAADLGTLAREVAELLTAEAALRQIRLSVQGSALAECDPIAVRRALLNLVRNAVQASRPGGGVETTVAVERGLAVARVLDRGPGLPAERPEHLLEPFVTTRADGTGLGIPMVRRVAEEHGGSFGLHARPGGGAIAELRIPATATGRLEAC